MALTFYEYLEAVKKPVLVPCLKLEWLNPDDSIAYEITTDLYNTNGTLKVREFRGSSKSNTLWSTKRTMQAWNSQRYIFGGPIPVGFAFKRPYEGGHGNQSHH